MIERREEEGQKNRRNKSGRLFLLYEKWTITLRDQPEYIKNEYSKNKTVWSKSALFFPVIFQKGALIREIGLAYLFIRLLPKDYLQWLYIHI